MIRSADDSSDFSDEEERLDRTLHSIDPLLQASLRRENSKRRQRQLLAGGILMGMLAVLVSIVVVFQIGPFHRVAHAEEAAALSAEGWQLWRQRKLPEAEKKFLDAVKLDDKDANIWNGLGWSQLNQGKTETALKSFEEALELDSKHPAALNGAGQSLLALHKFDEAKRRFKTAGETAPAALYGLIRIELLEENFDDAANTLASLKKVGGNGIGGEMLEQFEQAIKSKTLSDSLKTRLSPPKPLSEKEESAAALNTRGWQLFYSGKPRPAEVAFREALKIKPGYDAARNGLGFSLLNQGKPEQAQPIFDQLVKEHPDGLGYINGLARCYAQTSQLEKAVAVWKTGDKATSPVSALTSGLANTLYKLKRYDEALPYWKRIAKARPQDATARAKIKECQAKIAAQQ